MIITISDEVLPFYIILFIRNTSREVGKVLIKEQILIQKLIYVFNLEHTDIYTDIFDQYNKVISIGIMLAYKGTAK